MNMIFGSARWQLTTLLISLTLVLIDALVAPAGTCNDVQPISGVTGYQKRSNSPRCEGLYQAPVAGENLELLSLVSGHITYNLTEDKVLIVAVPNVRLLGSQTVNVRARALELGTYYRMDASVDSAQSMEWPLGAVLEPANLHQEDIGVLGWVGERDEKIYVPIAIVQKGKRINWQEPAVALFRSDLDIERFLWRLWPTKGRHRIPTWRPLASGPAKSIEAGDLIPLPIPRSPVVQELEVAAKLANSDGWLTLVLHVLVQ